MNDINFMKEALKEAEKAKAKNEIPIGAVVVLNGKIIARGHNMTECLEDPTAHAEMIAITSAAEALGGKYLKDCTLYVTVEPCPMCAGALSWSQVDRVVYGCESQQSGYSSYMPCILHSKTKVRQGVLAEECKKLVLDFFKRKRN